MPLSRCEHVFHRICMTNYIETQIESKRFPLRCPEPQCSLDIDDLDVREILTKKNYQKYSQILVNQTIDS